MVYDGGGGGGVAEGIDGIFNARDGNSSISGYKLEKVCGIKRCFCYQMLNLEANADEKCLV